MLGLLRLLVRKPEIGLPQSIFEGASYLLPLVNVEVVIRNKLGHIGLTWRERARDVPKAGWHIPGGIMRVGEAIGDRVFLTCMNECGIRPDSWTAVACSETILPIKDSRRHFISFIVEIDSWEFVDRRKASSLEFFSNIPENIIENHRRYKDLFGERLDKRDIVIYRDIEFEKSLSKGA
ncbi:hypothetical protein [Synechococcus sp. W4D4]|uniref:hypothetical protein n=1 Tax=Synechococcus sp. W4D4 TaxID=3392294 RepID=UPI0039E8BB64